MRGWKVLFTLTALLTVLASNGAGAQSVSKTKSEGQDLALQRERLQLEREKFQKSIELEQAKLDLETQKAWITGAATFVPLLVGALSIGYGVWNQNEQAKIQRALQKDEAQLQFELKAAELVLDAETPEGTKNKAKALMALFRNRLPKDFVASFDPKDFAINRYCSSRSAPFQMVGPDPSLRERIMSAIVSRFQSLS